MEGSSSLQGFSSFEIFSMQKPYRVLDVIKENWEDGPTTKTLHIRLLVAGKIASDPGEAKVAL